MHEPISSNVARQQFNFMIDILVTQFVEQMKTLAENNEGQY